MDPNTTMLFAGMIASASIIGGAIYSGLVKIAEAISKS